MAVTTKASSTGQANYLRIERAIAYLRENFRNQSSLEEVAAVVHLSPYHFQRLFTQWAGVSPKKFIQYLSLQHAKDLLRRPSTVFEASAETGLSGTGRLHDLFVRIEAMTPGEYKSGGARLNINYSMAESPFGNVIVASTAKGVCHLAFEAAEQDALEGLQRQFPRASLRQMTDRHQQDALFIFQDDWRELDRIKLHLAGTAFQLKVWESLLRIPAGGLATYGQVAARIGAPGSSRAVGRAIGGNPVAFLIPCHRVIRSSGQFGGYRWGGARKSAMIGWESARAEGVQ
ncbi:bifunctional transcriptional activator/DNA repair enzyme AdaA [Parahaliea mediterranea]|uniref:methylated-DNA--[protein]-cysteine S-methyltransferase n=1 Tax=Parahaliea mediterranea TaxID=651086 RepID=A0A939IJQ5_9GAMM|nr:methylated-DNA--[protein]-cysteine S-methyltransferase [Parahaliea mediterranea]MBN7797924.1 methylated-DNA--[protein]-cysteine S-methyltransferase [Parahaliea mediterranea]